MAADDSMSDDVFEAKDSPASDLGSNLSVLSPSYRTPSPTGYKDYRPPPELFEESYLHLEQVNHKTILLGDSGVGKTSLLVQFDTGKFQKGSFAATVGIGFTMEGIRVRHSKGKVTSRMVLDVTHETFTNTAPSTSF